MMSCTGLVVARFVIFLIFSSGTYALGINATITTSWRRSMCPPGTYSLNTGDYPCTECPPGSYSTDSGAQKCTPARMGHYVPDFGMKTEYPCATGTYADVAGSTSCSPCPLGHQCPETALEKPQPCPLGHFNNVEGATTCCACCSGYFNLQPGSTKCQACPTQRRYSNPGAVSQGACSSKKGGYIPEPTCTQKTVESCPTVRALPSNVTKREIRPPRCPKPGQKACPLYSATTRQSRSVFTGYDCVDIENDLESCGGCANRFLSGERSSDGGRDCSAIPNVDSVRCESRRCVIESCRSGSVKSPDGEHCTLTSILRKQE